MHCGRIIPGPATFPWKLRVQSAVENRGDAWVRRRAIIFYFLKHSAYLRLLIVLWTFLRMLPTYMLEIGKTAHEFFEQVRQEPIGHSYSATTAGPKKYRLKSMETYSRQHNVIEQPSKRYFQATTLPDIINSYPMIKKGMSQKEVDKGKVQRQQYFMSLNDELLTQSK